MTNEKAHAVQRDTANSVGKRRRLIRAIPVCLVVSLWRQHEKPAFVSQIIPVLCGSPSRDRDAGRKAMIVEWTCGTVSTLYDCDGIHEEEQYRNRHYFQLSASALDSTWSADTHARWLDHKLPNWVPPVAAFPSLRCRSRQPDTSRPSVSYGALDIRAVAQEQMRRLRWWSMKRQQVPPTPPSDAPHDIRMGSIAGLSLDRDLPWLHIVACRIVPADQYLPWSYAPSFVLQHLGGVHLHGANIASGIALPSVPAVMLVASRCDAPHDSRYISPARLNNALAPFAVDQSSRSEAERILSEARMAAMDCLRNLVRSRIVVSAEIFALRASYLSDEGARHRVHSLLDWYERHGTVEQAVTELAESKLVSPSLSESELIDEVAESAAETGGVLFLNQCPIPGELPQTHVLKSATRVASSLPAFVPLALSAAQKLGRTATMLELAVIRRSK